MPRTTVSKDLVFSGAHAVAFTHGGSERRHGHNWRLRVTIGATALDSAGMVMDFSELKKHTRVILDRFEHRDLNETPPFDKLNPTAENIAGLVFEELSRTLDDGRISVERVEVWETPRSRAVVER
jgi:6-pyruvoyltetrahydropterin/6-carboxytetrahydropterin synthase